jgi:hypothetical protein
MVYNSLKVGILVERIHKRERNTNPKSMVDMINIEEAWEIGKSSMFWALWPVQICESTLLED